MARDKQAPWVQMVYATDEKPAHFSCSRCGVESIVPFPVGIDDWNANIRKFVKQHRHCVRNPAPPADGGE